MQIAFLKRFVSVLLALVFALALIPSSLSAERQRSVPSGYNENDYNALADFLEQEDANGVKNGAKLSDTYNVNDPTTWGSSHFTFTTVSSKKRIQTIYAVYSDLIGTLDLSNCTSLTTVEVYGNKITALNVSGCTALYTLYCYDNRIEALDVSSIAGLSRLSCDRNRISTLDVSNNTSLVSLNCGANPIGEIDVTKNTRLNSLFVSNMLITSIDVSKNTSLKNFYCKGNEITEIDITRQSGLIIDGVYAIGDGTVGTELSNTGHTYYVCAVPTEGAEFIGWFDENDVLLSEDADYRIYSDTSTAKYYAHFTEVPEQPDLLPGDVNFDGSVDAVDALLVMRCAMNLISFTDEQLAAGDVNGDGTVNATDAVLIMRMALSIN
ncbi:MAG: hypothetical protein J5544_04630 [Clostridia bacterium]|nr:hypothetical protein [Clostridia bacterium]